MRRTPLGDKIFVIPQRDVVVKQDGQKLAPGGEWVEPSTYWRRRLADRAIVISRGPEQPKPVADDLDAPECSDDVPATVETPAELASEKTTDKPKRKRKTKD